MSLSFVCDFVLDCKAVADLKMISNHVTYMKTLSFKLAFKEFFFEVSNECGCTMINLLLFNLLVISV